jgi:cellulose synthase (UDP-forming)
MTDESLETKSTKIMDSLTSEGLLPAVLVMIPTYKEGVVVLRRTLRAVQKIDYPPRLLTVVVGDDGGSDDVRDFIHAEFPGFAYTRRKKIRGHAKAGNVNDVLLSGIDGPGGVEYAGDVVLLLDCDMAPQADILYSLVPLFYDLGDDGRARRNPTIAFVQSPQRFCNVGIDFLGQHYYFFYDAVLPAYSVYSRGVPCCGTNVLFDRQPLTAIGGMQYGSITEDFNTSLVLHSMGYKSRYCRKKTAVGFAPTTLLDFFYQRERWAIGGLEIVFCKRFWTLFRDLPLIYKWIYFFSGTSPIISIFFVILVLGPLVDIFLRGVFMCFLSTREYLTAFLPYIFVYVLGMMYLHRRLPLIVFFLSLQETIFMVPFNLYFLCSYIGKVLGLNRITFKITPKTLNTRKRREDQHAMIGFFHTMRIIFPFLLFYLGSIYGVNYGLLKNHWRVSSDKWVDIGWLGCIGLQLINPILFLVFHS